MIENNRELTSAVINMSVLYQTSTSLSCDLSWPFFCVSLMFTKESIQCLRSGVLNKECNKSQDIMEVINVMHQSCFYDFARFVIYIPYI